MADAIPAGYQLHISSWENDLDSPKTEIINGLSKEDALFLISIAKQFFSKNGRPKGLGNASIKDVTLIKLVLTALDEHPNISDDMKMHWKLELPCAADELDDLDDDELAEVCEQAYDCLCELIGSPVSEYYQDEPNFCRVYRGHEVFLIETPIICVTHEFS